MVQKAISEKSKKSDVLDAYYDLLEKLKNQAKPPREVQKQKDERATLEHVEKQSKDGIVQSLADLKITVAKSLECLETKLIEQFRVYTELNKAIDIAKKQLEELHQITEEADSLNALIEAQKQTKIEFEEDLECQRKELQEEIETQRKAWEQEKAEQTRRLEDEKDQTHTQWEREQEAFEYQRAQQRKQEVDAYQQQKQEQERELAKTLEEAQKDIQSRQKALQESEDEFKTLQQRVENFPEELEEAVRHAEAKAQKEIENKYKFQIELGASQKQSEKALYEQQLEALKNKIEEQNRQIQSLTEKADQATRQVEQIAVKAIDGASKARINLAYPHERE